LITTLYLVLSATPVKVKALGELGGRLITGLGFGFNVGTALGELGGRLLTGLGFVFKVGMALAELGGRVLTGLGSVFKILIIVE
jgi:hypothetical protein